MFIYIFDFCRQQNHQQRNNTVKEHYVLLSYNCWFYTHVSLHTHINETKVTATVTYLQTNVNKSLFYLSYKWWWKTTESRLEIFIITSRGITFNNMMALLLSTLRIMISIILSQSKNKLKSRDTDGGKNYNSSATNADKIFNTLAIKEKTVLLIISDS